MLNKKQKMSLKLYKTLFSNLKDDDIINCL